MQKKSLRCLRARATAHTLRRHITAKGNYSTSHHLSTKGWCHYRMSGTSSTAPMVIRQTYREADS
ncbi:hypothetical protein CR513_15356, partial [Mucuna pruriens]